MDLGFEMTEVPDEILKRLGKTYAEEFSLIKQDLFELRLFWRTYRNLFGTCPERVELLNSISGSFAHTIEVTLFETVLLKLRRINDTGSTKRNRKPLALGLLLKLADERSDVELKRLINLSRRKSEFAKNWSDKRIAHADYEYRMGRHELTPASRKKVTDAIDAVAAVIKWIGEEMLDTHYNTHPSPPLKNEEFVLKLLYEGKAVWDAKPELAKRAIDERRFEDYDRIFAYPDWLKATPDEWD